MEAGRLQKSMEMATSKCRKESEDEQTTSKQKRKKVDLFALLPDEILLEILKRVPEVFLRFKAKYVCRGWFNIITNGILLDHASFILKNMGTFTARLVDIREEEEKGLQVKELDLEIPQRGRIRSWCNEFVLMSGHKSMLVYNLITKKGSYLPQCNNASCGGHYTSGKCGVALSVDGCKGTYKVSHMYIGLGAIECQFFILGKHTITCTSSEWKTLKVPYAYQGKHIWGDPVTVQGRYLNWIIYNSNNLVSVDMVKEEIHIISLPVPGSNNEEEFVYSIFVMDGFLALMNRVSRDKAEIWLLKDFHRVKWDKLQLVSDTYRYFDRYPGKTFTHRIYGVINKRYIIYKSGSCMYSFDLKSGVQKMLDIYLQYWYFESDQHCVVHSLAPCFK